MPQIRHRAAFSGCRNGFAEEKGYFTAEGLDYQFRERIRPAGGHHHDMAPVKEAPLQQGLSRRDRIATAGFDRPAP
jgi:hypothetical protein